jgi:hypothetical protein
MGRYVNLKLTAQEASAVQSALECEITTRHAAAHNDLGERCDLPRGQGAIDDDVPAMERALAKVKRERSA